MKNIFNLLLLLPLLLAACQPKMAKSAAVISNNDPAIDSLYGWDGKKLTKTEEEWRKNLDQMSYYVLREKGTERAFTGKYANSKEAGVYCCAGCGLPLFDSKTKFDSGTGWPSFYQPIHSKNVGEITDNSHGMQRVEVVCNRCDGHLGHVFEDGPAPTGLRYCINSVSLSLKK